jgi:uncharacterized protein (DUF433 family)
MCGTPAPAPRALPNPLPQSVVDDYQSGMSMVPLAAKYGSTPAKVRQRLIDAGLTIGCRAILLPDCIGEEYAGGATTLALAMRYNTSAGHIVKKLASLGVRIRPPGNLAGDGVRKVKQADVYDIVKRYRAGDTLQAIATSYGVTRERIRQIAFKAGEPPRLFARIESGIERAAQKRGEIENRRAAKLARAKMLSALWIAGEPLPVIAAAIKDGLPIHNAIQEIVRLRKKHPKLFPYRMPNHHAIRK